MKKIILSTLFIFLFFTSTIFCQQKLFIDDATKKLVINELIQKFGEEQKFRIEKGVGQSAELWLEEDGSREEFMNFCKENFIGSPEKLNNFFRKYEFYSEIITGYFDEMSRDLNIPLDLDMGEITSYDILMGSYSPSAHITEDFFKNKVAFIGLLNFPFYNLEEKQNQSLKWSRQDWAYARIGGQFNTRIPASVNQKITEIFTAVNQYISEYNIFMNCLIDDNFNTYFPKNMKLISHWGLRDELKARYSNKEDLIKQQIIYKVMERIIAQEIPAVIINSDKYQWNPNTNKIYENKKEVSFEREDDNRYRNLLNVFNAERMYDNYDKKLPNHILRTFEAGLEIPEKDIESMFIELLSSKQVKEVSEIIKKRLNRKLYPFDIWYNGFKSGKTIPEEELDKIVSEKYPNIEAFQNDIKNILLKLGFSVNDAEFISSYIQVDPARGSGHAAPSQNHRFKNRLRTRFTEGGMNYKGYNIGIHELGHSVEQTLTLQKMDYYSLRSIPGTSFTEAFAFLFQDRDLEFLGLTQKSSQEKEMKVLDTFWKTYEIMGVALLDMKVWNWMYDNPNATPSQLKNAVKTIAKEIWNKYYADIFDIRDQTILAIYSHMIDNALYLPNYPIGHVIQFQIEDYIEGKNIGNEMMRMCSSGNILPQLWMKNAVGTEISVKPMLKAVDNVLKKYK